jgi:hypothetical protein
MSDPKKKEKKKSDLRTVKIFVCFWRVIETETGIYIYIKNL